MGYSHYWYRSEREISLELWEKIRADCEKVCKTSEMPLASWNGKGEPEFSTEAVSFNGREDCGHGKKELGIPWPAPKARGVDPTAGASGKWFAGDLIATRTCNGDCSYESFVIERALPNDAFKGSGGDFFACCKTAFRPYDLLVTACLIVFNHHMGDAARISSDGGPDEWADAIQLCQYAVGYGELPFSEEPEPEPEPEPVNPATCPHTQILLSNMTCAACGVKMTSDKRGRPVPA